MTKKELLEESIVKITKQAGLEMSGTFHLTPVSRDPGGLFIMEVMRPGRKRLCEAIRRVVTGFPPDPESNCIVLLPEVVDEIILAAQSGPVDLLQVSGRTVVREALMDVHRTRDETLPQM
jgi:hypothetical protein